MIRVQTRPSYSETATAALLHLHFYCNRQTTGQEFPRPVVMIRVRMRPSYTGTAIAALLHLHFFVISNKRAGIPPAPFLLFEFERTCIQLIIFSLLGDQLFVRAPFDNSSLFQHHDRIGIFYGRKPVRDNEHRSAFH